MSPFSLVIRELWHDRMGLILSITCLALVAAIFVGLRMALTDFDHRAQAVLLHRQKLVKERTRGLEDAMRRITKGLGFNVLIVPKEQELGELFAEDFASKTMPESYATRLAESRIVTVNHLLPTLERRLEWPERRGRTILLTGVRGEVPLLHRDPKKPLLEAVPKGHVAVGYELARSEQIETGDSLELLGKTFQVATTFASRGGKRDITIWVNLAEAQQLLSMQGMINGIWALQCKCALADIGKVRAEIEKILPDTQVIEKGSIALARAEARSAAAHEAEQALLQEKQTQSDLRGHRQQLAVLVIVTTALAASLMVGALNWRNVRDRRYEISLLRALGVTGRQIAVLILSKAAMVGLSAGVIGLLLGIAAVKLAGEPPTSPPLAIARSTDWSVALVVLAVPVIACVAAIIPALAATWQDPALVLREEG